MTSAEAAVRAVDGETIDNEVNSHIGQIQTLLKKKKDMLLEARFVVYIYIIFVHFFFFFKFYLKNKI